MSEDNNHQSFLNETINRLLTAEDKIELYKQMVSIRRFEERSIQSYQQGHIGGFCHTYIGQEAVAVGTISVLGPDDQIITGYRDHAHAIAVGMPMNDLMAELYGKATGCSRGKGGSMHFFDPERNYWGGHGIVGAQTSLGLGIGFALKYQEKKAACLCYLGDGAVNQGVFYESLNMASLWDIPVIYIIENNGYSMGTSQSRSSAGDPLCKRAAGFDIDYNEVAGNDIYAVRYATSLALDRAYNKSRPSVLEMKTYRYRGHSMSDPDQTYRSKEEIQNYKETQDAIARYEETLLREGILSEALIAEVEHSVKQKVDTCVQYAQQSPYPQEDAIKQDIYWEMDHAESKTSQGRMFFN